MQSHAEAARTHSTATSGGGSASTNTLVLLLMFVVGVGYVGCVQPMAEQLASMRRSVVCLENRLAKLVQEADAAGEGAGLLAALADQRADAQAAAKALAEIEAVNRRIATRTRQLALLANAEDQMTSVEERVSEQLELLGAAEHALRSAADLHRELAASKLQIEDATETAIRMGQVCEDLASAGGLADEAHTASEDLVALQHRVLCAADGTPPAEAALARVEKLSKDLAATTAAAPDANQRLAGLVQLKEKLVAESHNLGEANDTLDQLADLRAEFAAAGAEFRSMREMVLKMVLMQPAVDRAVAALEPMRRLAEARSPHAKDVRVADRNVTAEKQPAAETEDPSRL